MQQKQVRAKKRLGQHFLRNSTIIQKIVESLNLTSEDVVLEIGCGTGALTQELIGKARQYIGVELDQRMFHYLEQNFAGSQAVFLNQDILTLDLYELQKEYLPLQGKFKTVGNLPYYISSPIINYLAQHASLLELAVIMLQSEVADRLVARPGTKEYGVLTLIAQYYFETKELFSVHPRAFRPTPRVYSKILQLVPKASRQFASDQEAEFLKFLKLAFSQRRKTLRNSLKGLMDLEEKKLDKLLKKLNYPSDVRAERISLEDFIALFLGARG